MNQNNEWHFLNNLIVGIKLILFVVFLPLVIFAGLVMLLEYLARVFL